MVINWISTGSGDTEVTCETNVKLFYNSLHHHRKDQAERKDGTGVEEYQLVAATVKPMSKITPRFISHF